MLKIQGEPRKFFIGIRAIGLLFSSVLVVLTTACSTPPQIKQDVVMPARVDGLKQSKKIAFVKFKGDGSGVYTQKVETFFRNITVNGSPYFEIIERDALKKIIGEQKLAQSGLLSEENAVKAGNISGVDTLVLGSLLAPSAQSIRTTKERTDYGTCVRIGIKNKKKVCLQYRRYFVSCFTQSAGMQLTIKFVNVETAKSNYQGNYSGQDEHFYCEDTGSGVNSLELQENAFRQALYSMRKDVAPYKQRVSIELLDDEDDGSNLEDNGSALKLFEKGLKMVKNGNIDVGCTAFKEASSKYAHSPAIYYNLGVCTEIKANWSQALKYYKVAQSKIDDKSIPKIAEAIARVQKRMLQTHKVKQQSR